MRQELPNLVQQPKSATPKNEPLPARVQRSTSEAPKPSMRPLGEKPATIAKPAAMHPHATNPKAKPVSASPRPLQ